MSLKQTLKQGFYLSFLLAGLCSPAAFAGSITIYIPHISSGSYPGTTADYPVSWPFQDTKLTNAIPTATNGVTLFFWNPDTSSFTSIYWDEFTTNWSNPNYTLHNGEGFIFRNGTSGDYYLTLAGTDVTTTSRNRSFTAGKTYLIGLSYLHASGVWTECIEKPLTNYTKASLHLQFSNGDTMYVWDTANGVFSWQGATRKSGSQNCSTIPGDPFWEYVSTPCQWNPSISWGGALSAKIQPASAFYYTPAANVTWIEPNSASTCPEQI